MRDVGLPVQLDGTFGEGGGALVRTALALSALTLRPVVIDQVRGGTPYPGVSSEDVALAQVLGRASRAEVSGIELRRHVLEFRPNRLPAAIDVDLEPPTHADAQINLPTLLTAITPVLAGTRHYSHLHGQGETHAANALSYDVFAGQTLRAFRKFGLYAFPDLLQAGYGRGSLGEISLEIEPSGLTGCHWKDRGELRGITAQFSLSELPEDVAQRGVSHLLKLAQNSGLEVEVEVNTPSSATPGAFVAVMAEFERGFGSGASLGARGVRIEQVVQGAFEKFMVWLRSDATVDEYLADQLLVTACLAEGSSTFKVSKLTSRLLTTVWVIKQFMPIMITVKGREGEPGMVSIRH